MGWYYKGIFMMRKYICSKILLLSLIFLAIIPSIIVVSYASETVPENTGEHNVKVYDLPDYLNKTQEGHLLLEAKNYSNKYNLDLVFVITTDTQNLSYIQYADRFYDGFNPDKKEYGDDGILFLIDLDNGYNYISTSGEAIKQLTDNEIDWALTAADNVASDDYLTCFKTMLDKTMYYFEDTEDNYTPTKKPFSVGGLIIVIAISLALSVPFSLATFAAAKRSILMKHNAANQQVFYSEYTPQYGLTLVNRAEKLVDVKTYVNRGKYAPRTNSGGGGSSFHGGSSHSSITLSGGSRSHGGGGHHR